MNEVKLKKYSLICIIVAIISAFVEFFVITIMAFSVYNNTFLRDIPDIAIKVFVYTPWILLCAAVFLKLYFTFEIKKIEARNEVKQNEDRIKELERQVERLKKR